MTPFLRSALVLALTTTSLVSHAGNGWAQEAPPAAAREGAGAPAPAAPPAAETPARAADAAVTQGEWQASGSIIRPTRYPPDFSHYDYVNPDAPKGGTLNNVAVGSYDSFNPFIVRGTPAAGFVTFGGGLLYDTLMEQSTDEAGVSHGLIAEAIRYPSDFSSVSFRLDPDARWHDGEPITVEDVIWSFETLKRLHPQWNAYYRNVVSAAETGEREVTFTFDQADNRELPNIMGDLTVLPKHYWEGTNADGTPRDIEEPTLTPPLGSGAYKVASFDAGDQIRWERVPDYWAAGNPTRVGRFNYDTIDYVYFRDAGAAWEAFKKGGLSDYRVENSAQRWSEGYTFPAATSGDVIKMEVEDEGVGTMQGYVMNTRLEKFSDPRVREALTLAFNFEDMNRSLFYGLYQRIDSYFDDSELAATGLPSERELKFLEPLRGQIPEEVFTQEFTLPDYSDPAADRTYLRQAFELLGEAGYERRGAQLVNAQTGEPFTIEFLGNDPTDNRILEPFARQLGRLGIQTNIRIVDTNQYIARMNDFDFEVVPMAFAPQSLSPGNEQRDYWSSQAAQTPGSRNYAGISNPAVDALVNNIVFAENRDDLVAATRALDRVLLWNYYTVPQWNSPTTRVAYWDKFGMPAEQPAYTGLDPYSWWVESAENTGQAATQ